MLTDPHADKREKFESCNTCRFFMPSPKCHSSGGKGDHVTGDCRRMPPPPNYNGHPTVYIDGWCGEYQVDTHKIRHLEMVDFRDADCCARTNADQNHAPGCANEPKQEAGK